MAAIERRIFVATEAGVGSWVWRERKLDCDLGEVEMLLDLERLLDDMILIFGIQENMVGDRDLDGGTRRGTLFYSTYK